MGYSSEYSIRTNGHVSFKLMLLVLFISSAESFVLAFFFLNDFKRLALMSMFKGTLKAGL